MSRHPLHSSTPPRLGPDCGGLLGSGEVVESCDGNSWGTLRDRLAVGSALIFLAQEVGFAGDILGEKVRRRG
eukprot:7458407-Pyramimonas_sp.AAC.1